MCTYDLSIISVRTCQFSFSLWINFHHRGCQFSKFIEVCFPEIYCFSFSCYSSSFLEDYDLYYFLITFTQVPLSDSLLLARAQPEYLPLTRHWTYICVFVCMHRQIIPILQIRVLIYIQPRYNAVITWLITRHIYIKIVVKSVNLSRSLWNSFLPCIASFQIIVTSESYGLTASH